MKKTLFLFAMSICWSAICYADQQLLKIWLADGTVNQVSLNEEPVTTYSDGNLIITTHIGNTISYPLEKVRKYTLILGNEDAINPAIGESVRFSQNGEMMVLDGLKSGMNIYLYSTSGALLKQFKTDGSRTTVSVADMPVGVYMVKANGITYKIIKR